MFRGMCLLSLVTAWSVTAICQTGFVSRSVMAKQLVGQVLQLPPTANLSFNEKTAKVLGDSVAVAVMQSLNFKDFDDPGNRERVMRLLEQAFSEPVLISDPGDRQPGATLFLLDYLTQHAGTDSMAARARALTSKLQSLRSQQ